MEEFNENKNVIIASTCEGWMQKKGFRWARLWRNRYVRLRGDCLLYYVNDHTKEERGSVTLTEEAYIRDDLNLGFSIIPYVSAPSTKVWRLWAADKVTKEMWRSKLQSQLDILRMLSKYEIGRVIGIGGSGIVREYRHVESRCKIAVKMISVDDFQGAVLEQANGSFVLERVARIKHPNLISIYNLYLDIERLYVFMEYCTGGELFDHIVGRQHFSEDDAATVIRQLVSAVGALHDNGLVHLDVKPENILFATPSATSVVKLVDFGLSRLVDTSGAANGFSRQPAVGTLGYTAPEVLSRQLAGPPADAFSLGVVLHVLLVGYPPFSSGSSKEVVLRTCRGHLRVDGPGWARVSVAAKNLVLGLLMTDAAQRCSLPELAASAWLQPHSSLRTPQHLPSAPSPPLSAASLTPSTLPSTLGSGSSPSLPPLTSPSSPAPSSSSRSLAAGTGGSWQQQQQQQRRHHRSASGGSSSVSSGRGHGGAAAGTGASGSGGGSLQDSSEGVIAGGGGTLGQQQPDRRGGGGQEGVSAEGVGGGNSLRRLQRYHSRQKTTERVRALRALLDESPDAVPIATRAERKRLSALFRRLGGEDEQGRATVGWPGFVAMGLRLGAPLPFVQAIFDMVATEEGQIDVDSYLDGMRRIVHYHCDFLQVMFKLFAGAYEYQDHDTAGRPSLSHRASAAVTAPTTPATVPTSGQPSGGTAAAVAAASAAGMTVGAVGSMPMGVSLESVDWLGMDGDDSTVASKSSAGAAAPLDGVRDGHPDGGEAGVLRVPPSEGDRSEAEGEGEGDGLSLPPVDPLGAKAEAKRAARAGAVRGGPLASYRITAASLERVFRVTRLRLLGVPGAPNEVAAFVMTQLADAGEGGLRGHEDVQYAQFKRRVRGVPVLLEALVAPPRVLLFELLNRSTAVKNGRRRRSTRAAATARPREGNDSSRHMRPSEAASAAAHGGDGGEEVARR